jgi:hypothetical protein
MQDIEVVDESVDKIARAIFDRWTRGSVIEFAEGIEDALFLDAASGYVVGVLHSGVLCVIWLFAAYCHGARAMSRRGCASTCSCGMNALDVEEKTYEELQGNRSLANAYQVRWLRLW